MLIGAHQSAAGGYTKALERIHTIGGNCLQLFSASPRYFSFAEPSESTITEFIKLRSQLNISTIYFHATYLLNLGKEFTTAGWSRKCLINELKLASKLGVKGSVIHLGSFKNHTNPAKKYADITLNIKNILDNTPSDILFLIENAASNKIGKTLEEISSIIKSVGNERVRVCLDTCHLNAAGYDLSTSEKLEKFLDTFDSLIGLNKLELIHVNDSKDPFGSGRDQHENIRQGTLGLATFRLLLNHPRLKQLPFILEVPGLNDKGPDKPNLDLLKGLIFDENNRS